MNRINNFSKIIICWGAGDQFRLLREILKKYDTDISILIDDHQQTTPASKEIQFLPGKIAFEKWLTTTTNNQNIQPQDIGFVVAIGNPFGNIRIAIHNYLQNFGLIPITIADPSAYIADTATVKPGAQIMINTVINDFANIDTQCIINTGAIVEHDCKIESGSEIGPGATLCGRVKLQQNCWIGAGATVLPRLSIGENTVIGAGSVVTKDLQKNKIYTGTPAREYGQYQKYIQQKWQDLQIN